VALFKELKTCFLTLTSTAANRTSNDLQLVTLAPCKVGAQQQTPLKTTTFLKG
jgi:hypothetical protein